MITDIKELDALSEANSMEEAIKILEEKVGISINDIKESICKYVDSKAEELTHDFKNIIPTGEYDNVLEDNDSMATFLRERCTKVESWDLSKVAPEEKRPLIQFTFNCNVIDDPTSFQGHVFVSFSGVIRHSFAQAEE